MRPLLGTFVEVAAQAPQALVDAAVSAAFECLQQAQWRWSFHDPDSELSRLNRGSGVPLALHRQTLRLLRLARTLTRRSGGAFNCTVGGWLVRQGVLPDHGGELIEVGDADDFEVGATSVQLHRPVRLTLDGIAKGYAVDLAVGVLKRHGARAGWVNAGGDLRVFGDLAMPLQRREPDGRLSRLGALRDAAIATSQRAAPGGRDPRFPGHIVLTPCGAQVAARAGVWSVLARSAWRADALTKVAANAVGSPAEAVARLGGRLLMPGQGRGSTR